MKVFITGGAGFIGKNLLETLSFDPKEVLLLAKDEKECDLLNRYSQHIIKGDFGDLGALKKDIKDFKPEVCIHLAWEGIPDFSFETCKKNLDSSLSLVNFVVNETNCKKIIISGTCLEYGKTKGACSELDNVKIASNFTWAKYALYLHSEFMCRRSKKDLIWFRIFYAYGPGQRKESLIPTLVSSFKNGKKPIINNPLSANDFIYVDDIGEAFKIAAKENMKPGVYNLGRGISTKTMDISEIVEQHISGKIDTTNQIKKDPASKERDVGFWADMSKTKSGLNWSPKTNVTDGIAKYIESLEAL